MQVALKPLCEFVSLHHQRSVEEPSDLDREDDVVGKHHPKERSNFDVVDKVLLVEAKTNQKYPEDH